MALHHYITCYDIRRHSDDRFYKQNGLPNTCTCSIAALDTCSQLLPHLMVQQVTMETHPHQWAGRVVPHDLHHLHVASCSLNSPPSPHRDSLPLACWPAMVSTWHPPSHAVRCLWQVSLCRPGGWRRHVCGIDGRLWRSCHNRTRWRGQQDSCSCWHTWRMPAGQWGCKGYTSAWLCFYQTGSA